MDPDTASAYNGLAWLLATRADAGLRNGSKAVELARKACELVEWKDEDSIETLAAACAETGNFDEAIKWENKYLDSKPPKENADQARERLALYAKKMPYHEAAWRH
jgi:serine/threonine-protein kinase